MNPDTTSAEYQIALHNAHVSAAERERRQADLHRLAVARRRKAKRGGKR